VLWAGGTLDFALDDDTEPDPATIDAECYDLTGEGGSLGETYYEYCWFPTTSDKTACEEDENLINCEDQTECTTSATVGAWREDMFDTTETRYREQRVSYFECGSSPVEYQSSTEDMLIMDKKKSVCVDATHYAFQGHYLYGVGTHWFSYESGACSGSCNTSLESGEVTNENTQLTPPCTAANGTVDLAIVDIIPIQVIPNVDMVKDKSGYVVVNVTNYGTTTANGTVHAWFNGDELVLSSHDFAFSNSNNRLIQPGAGELFVFDFKPGTTGTNLVVNATVEVSS
jgi:hypothetical protein